MGSGRVEACVQQRIQLARWLLLLYGAVWWVGAAVVGAAVVRAAVCWQGWALYRAAVLAGMGASIIDSLDTLWIMGLKPEFARARTWVATSFNINVRAVCTVNWLAELRCGRLTDQSDGFILRNNHSLPRGPHRCLRVFRRLNLP